MHKVFLVLVIIATLCGSVLMYYTLTSPSDEVDPSVPVHEEGATTTTKEAVIPSEGTITTNPTTSASKDITHMPTQKSSPKQVTSEIVAIEGKITLLDTVDSSPIRYALQQEDGTLIFVDPLYSMLLEGMLEVVQGKGIEPIIVGHGKIETDSKKQSILTDAEFYIQNDGFEVILDSIVTFGTIDSQGYQEVIYIVPKGIGWWNANTVPGKLFLDTKSSAYTQFRAKIERQPNNIGDLRLTVTPISIGNGMNSGTVNSDRETAGRFVITGVQYDIPGYL